MKSAQAIHAKPFSADYEFLKVSAFDWLARAAPQSIHTVVMDPPYDLLEYTGLDRFRGRVN